jgi:putative protease
VTHPAQDARTLARQVWLLEETNRPGEAMPMEEDEHGAYLLNSRDLRAIEHVHQLVKIGINSMKIEGRTKSAYYVARTCQSYRGALDDALAGRPFDPRRLADLEHLAHRGYTDGFYQRHHDVAYQNYLRGYSAVSRSQYVGDVGGFDPARGLAEIIVKNRFETGHTLEIVHPAGNCRMTVTRMEDAEGRALAVAPGSGHRVWMPLPGKGSGYDGAFLARIF